MSFFALPGIISGRGAYSGYMPADVPSQVGRWDMVDSSITTSSGNVTQVDDLVASANLVLGIAPADVASDSDLGGRRACQHVAAGVEYLTTGLYIEYHPPWTLALVCTVETISNNQGILYIENGYSDTNELYKPATALWGLQDGSPDYDTFTGGTMAVDTAYLVIWVNNGVNTTLYVNGTATVTVDSYWDDCTVFHLALGTGFSQGAADMTWTMCMLTSVAMAEADRDGLLEWAQALCGVA